MYMLEVPFDQLVKDETYYIQTNSSINPDFDRTYKKMGEFDRYYETMYDDEDLTIAQFKNIRDVPNSSGRPRQYPFPTTTNGFIEETTRFFLPQKDKLMFKQVMSGVTKSDVVGKDLANTYFGGKRRKNKKTKGRKNKTKTSKRRKTKRVLKQRKQVNIYI